MGTTIYSLRFDFTAKMGWFDELLVRWAIATK